MKTKEIGIWIGVTAVLIAGLWLLIIAVTDSPAPSDSAKITGLPEVSSQDFTKGEKSAKTTVIEYGDFECPACASYYPILTKLSSEFGKDLRIVHRFFPLISVHKNAMIAAQAAYASGIQSKFWEMHNMLYENQKSWTNTQAKDVFIGYANDLGLDLDKFKTDLDANSTIQFIKNQQETGILRGINSTPTFFVNGNHIENPSSYEAFKEIVQDEINKK